MSHMGLTDLIEAVTLYQLDNPAETGFHVGRQDIELLSNPFMTLAELERWPLERNRDDYSAVHGLALLSA